MIVSGSEALDHPGLTLRGLQLMPQASLVDGLSLNPFAFGKDGLPAVEVYVGGRQIADALVIACVVVVFDEGGDLPSSSSGR